MQSHQPVKVLHIMETIQMGGVEQFLLNQYRLLSTEGITFDFVVYGRDKTKESKKMVKNFTYLGSHVHSLPNPNASFISFLKALKKLFKEENYDVVHCHQNFFSGIVLPIAKLEGIPVRIAHAHTAQERKKMTIKRKIYHYLMRKAIFSSATHLLGASPMANTFLYGNAKKAEFLPNGIDVKSFSEDVDNSVKEEYLIPENAHLIGHVGNFKPMKNHIFLMDLFSELKQKNIDAHLVLVGEGENRKEMEERARLLDCRESIHFLGRREDVPNILKECDLFLFPSTFEGLGISAIEAQLAGVHVIMSDTLPKEIDLDMNMVERLSLGDRELWIEKIMYHLNNKDKNGTVTLRERIEKLQEKGFTNHSSAKRLEQIYNDEIKT